MRVAIIGKGISSIIQACTILDYRRRSNDVDISIFYDPNIPPISVGESSTNHFINLLNDTLGITLEELFEKHIATKKRGVVFLNWGEGIPFIHGFGDGNKYPINGDSGLYAFQFDTVVLNEYITQKLKEKGVQYIPEKVETQTEKENCVELNGREFDFVINCTGWNFDKSLNETPRFHSVNAGYLYSDESFNLTSDIVATDLTVHNATEDGWEFNLPFPCKGVMKKGYLFNTDYISPEEVTEKMKSRGKEGKVITWRPKRSKRLIESKFTSANGNRLFFVEPLQAYSVVMYITFGYMTASYIYSDKSEETRNKFNLDYRAHMISYEQELAWHYQYGSIFKDSKFWQDKTREAKETCYFHPTARIEDLDYLVDTKAVASRRSMVKIFMHSFNDLIYVHKWMRNLWTEKDRPKFTWMK